MIRSVKGSLSFRFFHRNPLVLSFLPRSCYIPRPSILIDLITLIILDGSQRPSGLGRGSAANCLLILRVRILPGAWMSFSCESCSLSGRCLCDGPIPSPEESYQLSCVFVCDLEIPRMRRVWLALGCCARERQRERQRER
jgi:hypothetical protein